MATSKKSVAIYARVSTDKQKVDMQLKELRAYAKRSGFKIHQEFIDEGYTGSNTKRPAYNAMLDDARQKKFDLLLVWKLDRLSRSLKDLITTLDELGHLGVDFISYDNKMDTSTPTGKLVYQIVGAVAEFEKDIIRERVKAGLKNAKAKGKKLGRPTTPKVVVQQIEKLKQKGLSNYKIADKLGIGEATVRKKLKMSPKVQEYIDKSATRLRRIANEAIAEISDAQKLK